MSSYRSTASFILRLIRFGPLERRPKGGWRFGAKRIADSLVEQLVAAGRARIEGDRVIPVQQGETP